MRQFIVARNRYAADEWPFLLHVPLGDHGFWLLAKESWPRSSRVFCFPIRAPQTEPEVLERVEVASCAQAGIAVDLVLKRGTHNYSQFIFTQKDGRRRVFWTTEKAAKAAKPGLRIPFPPPSAHEHYLIDSRERYGYKFAGNSVEKCALPVGDYAVRDADGNIVGAVERKTMNDLFCSLNDGTKLCSQMAKLTTLRHAAVVVEAEYAQVLRHPHTNAGYLPELVARLAILYPRVPILFLGTRRIAEVWTFRFLRLAQADAEVRQLELTLSTTSSK